MFKQIFTTMLLAILTSNAWACLDCGGADTDAVYTGTITANGIISPTIDAINHNISVIQSKAVRGTVDVIVGTFGAQGVDYSSNNIRDVTNQIYSDRGVSLGSTNTVPLTIFFKPGVYGGNKSTCPPNVTWLTLPLASSTVYALEQATESIVTTYGTIDGFTFDGGSMAIQGAMVNLKNRSVTKNWTVIGADGLSNYSQGAVFNIERTSNVILSDGWMKQWRGAAGRTWQGNAAAIRVNFSTDTVTARVLFSTPTNHDAPYETTWGVLGSVRATLQDCTFEGVNAIAVSIGSGRDYVVKRNQFNIGAGSQGDGANYGLITLDGSDEVPSHGASTATIISDNYFTFVSTGGASGNIIRSRSFSGNGIGNGYLIANNVVSSFVRTNWTFYKQVGGSVFTTVLSNNHIYNLETFIADSGIGTLSTGNTLDGKLQ